MKDEIIKMAREVELEWLMHNRFYEDHLERFFHMAQAAEREACAKVVDDMAAYMEQEMEPSGAVDWVRQHAAAIRARGQA